MNKRILKFRVWDTEVERMCEWDRPVNCWERWLRGDDPKAVIMQFTGLLDKNGKEIYEGDIVQRFPFLYTGEIGWQQDGCAFEVFAIKTKGTWKSLGLTRALAAKLEVIGNIYEHPHLLIHPNL